MTILRLGTRQICGSEQGTGCGAAWLARLTGGQEVPGSNPGSPTSRENADDGGRYRLHTGRTTPRSRTRTGRLGQSLHLSLKKLPKDDDLLSELGHVRLRETGIGQARLDHDSGSHHDQAECLSVACAELIGNVQTSGGRQWLESLAPPPAKCQAPNPIGSLICRVCRTPIEPTPEPAPYVPEPVAARPWSPTSPFTDNVQAPPGQAQTLRFLREYQEQDWTNWAFGRRT